MRGHEELQGRPEKGMDVRSPGTLLNSEFYDQKERENG